MAFGPCTLDLSYSGAMMNVSNVCTGFRLGGFCARPTGSLRSRPKGKKCYLCSRSKVLPMFPNVQGRRRSTATKHLNI
jgi:hypothetical protein